VSERPRLRALPGGASTAKRAADRGAGTSAAGEGLAGPLARVPAAAERLAGHAAGGSAIANRRGIVAGALAAAGSWLLEPAPPPPESTSPSPSRLRPVVAVFGLARGCGVTVVSRALAAELASRDVEGAAAVHCDARPAGIPLATHAAARLARALADVPGADTRPVGRLCLVRGAEHDALADTARHFAPLVLDAGSTSLGGAPAALADRVIVVATAATQPALASVAADCLARLGHEPIVVLNRTPAESAPDRPPSGWSTRTTHHLPDSRMGAQLALGGREPRGELGRAIAELADLCEERR
jgi:hypothetical protein